MRRCARRRAAASFGIRRSVRCGSTLPIRSSSRVTTAPSFSPSAAGRISDRGGMPDFITPNCELTTGEIAALTRAKLRDGDPLDRRILNIAPLDSAGACDISFLDNSKYLGELAGTRAG